MKIRYIIIIFLFLVASACSVKYSTSISVRIEFENKDSCNYLCNKAKLNLKNNTNERYYIPVFGIKIEDRNGFDIKIKDLYYTDRYVQYLEEAEKNGFIEETKCSCEFLNALQDDISTLPEGFLEDAVKKELSKFGEKNNCNIDNLDIVDEIKNWVKTIYESRIYLLEPREECFVDIEYLDLLINEKKSFALCGEIDARKHRKEKWIEIEHSSDSIVYFSNDYLPEINGYKLLSELIKSNTIVFRNGEFAKNNPPEKGNFCRMKFLNKIALMGKKPSR